MEECDDCGQMFCSVDEGTNEYIFKCAPCYKSFLATQDSWQSALTDDSFCPQTDAGNDPLILKRDVITLHGAPGFLYKLSNATYRLVLEDGSLSKYFSDQDYLGQWMPILENVWCTKSGCNLFAKTYCINNKHWLCLEHSKKKIVVSMPKSLVLRIMVTAPLIMSLLIMALVVLVILAPALVIRIMMLMIMVLALVILVMV